MFINGNIRIPIRLDRYPSMALVTPDMHRVIINSIVVGDQQHFASTAVVGSLARNLRDQPAA